MRGQGLNDLPCCDLERRSSHHKGIFFEVPKFIMRKSSARIVQEREIVYRWPLIDQVHSSLNVDTTALATVIDETGSDIAELIRRDFETAPATKDLHRASLDWVHYRARCIPCRPRQVFESKEVRSKLSMYPAISRIYSALRAGEDVSACLSRKIETLAHART
jgi:hypothetical protein